MEPAAAARSRNRRDGDFFPIASAVAAAALAALAIFHIVQTLRRLSGRYALYDFAAYYKWGRQYQGGIEWWARSHCNYTPFFVAGFAPLTRIDPRWLHPGWQIFQLACLIGAMILVAQSAGVFSARAIVALAAASVLSRTSDQVLFFGQFAPMLLLLMVGSWTLARARRDAASALLLALAILLKLYPGILLGYYLVCGKWRVLIWTAAFFALGMFATGFGNWRGFIVYGLPHSGEILARGFWRDRVSIFNLVWGLEAAIAAPSWWTVFAPAAAVSLVLVVAAAIETTAARARSLDGIYFSLWLALGLLLAPIAWHHEIVLLFPLYFFGALCIARIVREAELTTYARVGFFVIAIAMLTVLVGREYAALFKNLLPTYLVPSCAFIAGLILVEEQRPEIAGRGKVVP
ncbi:MAG TPA: glycosyltransferase family 87 protein [Candidatus Binataceae bacterium]|nr:glycosyltransferase family 87 protein [Candidatus Binataceae bacterium]